MDGPASWTPRPAVVSTSWMHAWATTGTAWWSCPGRHPVSASAPFSRRSVRADSSSRCSISRAWGFPTASCSRVPSRYPTRPATPRRPRAAMPWRSRRATLRRRRAASCVGLAQAAFEAALRYSQQRSAFGQAICHHQAIQLKLADMATAITAARVLTYDAAERLASGDDVTAGLARLQACETASMVTLEAMRIHGGYGYTTEFLVERYYRDAPRLALALGGVEAERVALARSLTWGPRDGPQAPSLRRGPAQP